MYPFAGSRRVFLVYEQSKSIVLIVYIEKLHNNTLTTLREKGGAMRRTFLLFILVLVMSISNIMHAAEVSSDKMILEWNTSKVWISGENLCVNGTMTNKRDDLTITKLNDFVIRISFTDEDGQKRIFTGKPLKLPICKIAANASRKLSFNFGKYDHSIKDWVTSQEYTFTYINGARF